MNRLTLDQQIIAMDWTKLNRKQIKAQLTEWLRYYDKQQLCDLIYKSHHSIPPKLTKVMDSINMIYASVYDQECEA